MDILYIFKKYRLYIILLFLIIAFIFIFLNAGNFLVIDDLPKDSDVIIVLGGDTGNRAIKAVELYKEGYADKIIFSGGQLYYTLTQAQAMSDHAIILGADKKDIILEEKATSTFDNALYCKKIMLQKNYGSAIVVTSSYHTKRAKFIFEKMFQDSSIELTFCATYDPQFVPSKWWKSNKSIMHTLTEYLKFLGYALGKNV